MSLSPAARALADARRAERLRADGTVDLVLHLHAEKVDVILVSDDGERKNAVFLPRCWCSWSVTSRSPEGNTIAVTLPEWLAIEKGLV